MNFQLHPPHENDIKFAQDNDIEIEIGTNLVEVWHRYDDMGLSIMCHDMKEIDEALDRLHDEYSKDIHAITLED